MSEKCRLCLKLIPIESVIKLYYFLPETTEAAEKMVLLIAKYLHIKVKKDDIVSTTICHDCNDHLEDFHKFCEDIAAKQLALQNELLEVDLKTESPHFEDNEKINSTYLIEEEVVKNKILAAEQAMLECPIDVVKNEFVSDKEDDDFCVHDMLKENTTCLIEEEVVENKISVDEQAMLECPIDVVKNEFVSDEEDDDYVQDMLKENTEEKIYSMRLIKLDSDKEDDDDMVKADINKNDAEEYKPPDDIQTLDDDMPLIQLKTRKKKTKKFACTTSSNKEKRDISKPKQSEKAKPKNERQPKLSGQQLIASSLELKCDICQTHVSTWKELEQHLLAAHTRTPYIKCCGSVYEKERPLVDHLQWHKNPDAFKCQLCEDNLKNSRDLTTHISTVHPDNVDLLQQYECERCFKQFRSFIIYKHHLRTHNKDRDVECHIRNKRKITNLKQFAKMVQLLEEKPELARSYHQLNTKEEWNKIAEKLNPLGPPSRLWFEWMKVWADYKCKLKKKLIQNMAECRSAGGGPYKRFFLSTAEKAASRLLQLNSIVNSEGDAIGIQQATATKTERIMEEYANEKNEENEAPTTFLTRSARKYIAVHFVEENENHAEISRRRLRDSSNVLEMPTNQFVGNFRVSKDIFVLLLRMLEDKWARGIRRTAIRPDVKLATFLRFAATGSYQQTVGNECVSSTAQTSASRIICECLKLFEEWICPEWIKMPSSEEERSIMEAFFDIAGFPGVIGCVDGTHIRIKSPGDDLKHLYSNRKAYSINTMMVCDHKMTIMYVDARNPGAKHDSFIWEQSTLDQRLQNAFDNGKRNTWILGDGEYKLKPFVMTPFRDPKDAAERLYNKKHASARNVIERCIGLLKNTFRCLIGSRRLHYEPERATQIINACCALHNMCIKYNCSSEPAGTLEVEEANVSNNDVRDEFEPIALAIRRGIAINL